MLHLQEVVFQGLIGVVLVQLATVYAPTFPTRIFLTFSSLPRILLSRFLMNLRQVATPSDSRHSSHFSTLNFHMPTMDEVIDNLGEPMDFVEYRVDCDDEGWEVGCDGIEGNDVPADMELLGVVGPSATTLEDTGPSEGSNSSSSGAHIDVTDIRVFEIQEEVRFVDSSIYIRRSDRLGQRRRSSTLPV